MGLGGRLRRPQVIRDRTGTGDRLVLHAYGNSRTVTVRNVLEKVGVAGWNEIWAPPGTIDALFVGAPNGSEPPQAEIIVSNVGGVFDSLASMESITAELESRLSGVDTATVVGVKSERLEEAEMTGAEFTTLFSGIGGFSVLAGVLLLVNLFVMLTEERKTELGMLRAVGLKQSGVARASALEGAFYSIIAAIAGSTLGVGIGWIMLEAMRGIFGLEENGLPLRFTATLDGVATGALIGLSISMLTVWVTSGRISRLNVIAAIRDLPNMSASRGGWVRLVAAVSGLAVGAGATWIGVRDVAPTLLLVGPAIAAFSLMPILARFGYARTTTPLVATALLVWSVVYTGFFQGIGSDLEINVFVVQGAVLVAAATVIAVSADRAWMKAVDLLGRGVAWRLALAYPLARRVRSGLLLAMYSLVIFTIAFLTAFSSIFTAQASAFAESTGSGFEIFMETNLRSPVDSDQIVAFDEVETIAPLTRRGIEFDVPGHDETRGWAITGFTEALLSRGGPKLSQRSPEFASDLDAFQAVLDDPGLVIVDPFLMSTDNATGAVGGGVGEVITGRNPETGEQVDLEVVGLFDAEFLFHGAMVGLPALQRLFGESVTADRYFVGLLDHSDPAVVANQLNAEFLVNGADAEAVADIVGDELAETTSFLRLLQGFLGLGLIIGIAGLGVVLVRAVRERRREIGMLRALGVPSGLVRRAFVAEASFIAVQGIMIGIGLGLITARQVIVGSEAFGGSDLTVTVSWVGIATILVVPLVASLLAAVGPAQRAAQIRPAEALRLAD